MEEEEKEEEKARHNKNRKATSHGAERQDFQPMSDGQKKRASPRYV